MTSLAGYVLSDAARSRLESELSELIDERETRAVESGNMCGDAADIAEFAARDMRLEHLDRAIARIHALLAESTGAQTPGAAPGTIGPGSRFRVLFGSNNNAERFVLGDRAERAADVGVITVHSPLGRALIGARAGDTVEYSAPAGTLQATVLELTAD